MLEILESRLKLLSGQTGVSVEQKIAEMQDTVRKAKVKRKSIKKSVALFGIMMLLVASDKTSNSSSILFTESTLKMASTTTFITHFLESNASCLLSCFSVGWLVG